MTRRFAADWLTSGESGWNEDERLRPFLKLANLFLDASDLLRQLRELFRFPAGQSSAGLQVGQDFTRANL